MLTWLAKFKEKCRIYLSFKRILGDAKLAIVCVKLNVMLNNTCDLLEMIETRDLW